MEGKLKIFIYINKELYRSMKGCYKKIWKSVLVFNPISCRWQLKKYLNNADVDIENILDEIGAEYKVIHTCCYIYITISNLDG